MKTVKRNKIYFLTKEVEEKVYEWSDFTWKETGSILFVMVPWMTGAVVICAKLLLFLISLL
jgi:hypothetical protein